MLFGASLWTVDTLFTGMLLFALLAAAVLVWWLAECLDALVRTLAAMRAVVAKLEKQAARDVRPADEFDYLS